jgi:hypothetical protein
MVCCCLYCVYTTRKAVYFGFRSATSHELTVLDGYLLPLPAAPEYPTRPLEAIMAQLHTLDCPAKKGWYCHKESPTIVARCGASFTPDGAPSGSRTLEVSTLCAELSKAGISHAAFLNFWRHRYQKYDQKPIDDLMNAFLSSGSPEVKYILDKYEQETKAIREQYEAESLRVKAENDKRLYFFAFGGSPARTPVKQGTYSLLAPEPEIEERYAEFLPPALAPAAEPEMRWRFAKVIDPAITVHFSRTEKGDSFPLVVKKGDLPLGISFHNELPIKLSKVEPGKWAARSGVEVGWYIREIDLADRSEGKRVGEFKDFESCKEYIFGEFSKMSKATSVSSQCTLSVKKNDLPLGISFHDQLPIRINKVDAGHWGARNGVLGCTVLAIDGREMSEFKDFQTAKKYIFDEVAKLGQYEDMRSRLG